MPVLVTRVVKNNSVALAAVVLRTVTENCCNFSKLSLCVSKEIGYGVE